MIGQFDNQAISTRYMRHRTLIAVTIRIKLRVLLTLMLGCAEQIHANYIII